jgi:Bacteriophage minor capsid protein
MISVNDIATLLKDELGIEVYPLTFPKTSGDACSTVEVTYGYPSNAGVSRCFVQIITRDVHPALAEETANRIRSFLDKRTDFYLGETQVIYVSCQTPIPLYIGVDDNQRHLFSVNYLFILGV